MAEIKWTVGRLSQGRWHKFVLNARQLGLPPAETERILASLVANARAAMLDRSGDWMCHNQNRNEYICMAFHDEDLEYITKHLPEKAYRGVVKPRREQLLRASNQSTHF